jgi:chemotaxis protein methyltransferase CheR
MNPTPLPRRSLPAAPAPGTPAAARPFAPVSPIEVDEAGYATLTRDVKALLGLDLAKYKPAQVWRRVLGFGTSRGYATPVELVAACRADPNLKRAFRDMITINVSEFFRNPEAWEALRTRFLAPMLGRPLTRVWSAGCSLGYEPYTIAMLVREGSSTAAVRISATDVDDTILAQARASRYGEAQMVGVSTARRARFFSPVDGAWEVRPEVRSLVTWRRHDLLRDPFERGFDLIACRNVVIYFTETAKAELYRGFAASLLPGGILFIGATVTISAARDAGLELVVPGFYRKIG